MAATMYTCHACGEEIPPSKALIRCEICQSFDLCANCFVTGRTAQSHTPYHPTKLFKRSELVELPPPPLPPRPSSTNPPFNSTPQPPQKFTPATTTFGNSPQQHQYYTPPSGQPSPAQYTVPPPPPLPAPYNAYGQPQELQAASPHPYNYPPPSADTPQHYQAYASNTSPAPPQPPRPVSSSSHPQGPGSGLSLWSILFDGEIPTQAFVQLMTAFFTHLDPQRKGTLTPEVYSSFLDAQGYATEHNVWKMSLTPVFGVTAESHADSQIRAAFENFSIEHQLAPRPVSDNASASSIDRLRSSVSSYTISGQHHSPASSSSDNMMPLLTFRGFVDITAVEVLGDPSKGWLDLNRALRAYQLPIWKERGDLPRNCLPEFAPPRVTERIKRIQQEAERKAREKLDALKAQHMLEAQANQNALDLIDGPQYVYRY
ncbi:hypothetical protein K402DRAFT_389269 [Aulographum hederae CBS 113979]|uniref:ZZ-type domain-containing protein n=1 Tax=Aulographum hederae CBS 113979 TaxID=1176131 RepID=A0A6G1HDH2_9PEZI|nr:hypothetical protein K402DRAFT_389269 [Aulographum hederae CBS 113979]